MTFLDRWFADWLRASGHRVDLPGTPDPRDPNEAAKLLRHTEGWRVFAPGVDLPVQPISIEQATAVLAVTGHKVFPPREPPALGPWVPTVKGEHPVRDVTATDGVFVEFSSLGEQHRIKAGSFWKWRSEVNAVHRGAVA